MKTLFVEIMPDGITAKTLNRFGKEPKPFVQTEFTVTSEHKAQEENDKIFRFQWQQAHSGVYGMGSSLH